MLIIRLPRFKIKNINSLSTIIVIIILYYGYIRYTNIKIAAKRLNRRPRLFAQKWEHLTAFIFFTIIENILLSILLQYGFIPDAIYIYRLYQHQFTILWLLLYFSITVNVRIWI